ncbi:MAG: aldo/keto reductase, partial [bacterium]
FRSLIPECVAARIHPYLGSSIQKGSVGGWVVKSIRALLMRKDFSVKYLRMSVEASLTRLRTDRIDLLQLHSPSAFAIDRDAALDTLARLRDEGKIRFYGLAFATWIQMQQALRDNGVSTLQLPISAGVASRVHDLLTWARQRGIGVIANQPLKKGALVRDGGAAAIRFVASLPAVSTMIVGTTNISHLDENVAALDSSRLTEKQIACGSQRP